MHVAIDYRTVLTIELVNIEGAMLSQILIAAGVFYVTVIRFEADVAELTVNHRSIALILNLLDRELAEPAIMSVGCFRTENCVQSLERGRFTVCAITQEPEHTKWLFRHEYRRERLDNIVSQVFVS